MDRGNEKLIIGKSKTEWAKLPIEDLKEIAEKKSWIALNQFLDEKGNDKEADIATRIIATLAKEQQALNGAAAIEIMREKLAMRNGRNYVVNRER